MQEGFRELERTRDDTGSVSAPHLICSSQRKGLDDLLLISIDLLGTDFESRGDVRRFSVLASRPDLSLET
jgi:hypothetical protein